MKIYLLINDVGHAVIGSTIKTPLIEHIKKSGYRKVQGYAGQFKKTKYQTEYGERIPKDVFCYMQEIMIIHKGKRIRRGAKLLE